MPRCQQQPPDARLPDQRSPARLHLRQIARLPRRDLAVAQLVADTRYVVDDVVAPRLVDHDVRG